ncbi:MAG: DNA cytosine methyltransferase [Symploca sp. SIO2E9]|nr:DNA cytosine methyltransferase [Symploca sp. SIO2E9]
MLTQLDLCSGVGAGFPLAGLQLGGFELIGLCERDDYCRDILSKRFNSCYIHTDVRDTKELNSIRTVFGEIDLISASPPCQPFSVQGKRKGAADERDCFNAVCQAIARIQPKFFCIENVPGLLNCPYCPGATRGYFRHILGYLSEFGYDAEWICVGSAHFGAAFIGERLLLVGSSRRLKLNWESATPWSEQSREQVETARTDWKRRGGKPGFPREAIRYPQGMDISPGVKNGSSTIRRQREAIGNSLDWRIAQLALRRVLYLNSLCIN